MAAEEDHTMVVLLVVFFWTGIDSYFRNKALVITAALHSEGQNWIPQNVSLSIKRVFKCTRNTRSEKERHELRALEPSSRHAFFRSLYRG